jgi:hypothetical protein
MGMSDTWFRGYYSSGVYGSSKLLALDSIRGHDWIPGSDTISNSNASHGGYRIYQKIIAGISGLGCITGVILIITHSIGR